MTDDRQMLTLTLTLEKLTEDVHSIRRTLVGAPEEGSRGMIARLTVLERRVALLTWLLPFWITGGTALGQWLVKLWGI